MIEGIICLSLVIVLGCCLLGGAIWLEVQRYKMGKESDDTQT